MSPQKFSMDDYIDVAERIQDFQDATEGKGSLQTIAWEVVDVKGKTFVVYRAAAYRTPDDPRPGHGIAWEPFPGGTPYTRDSELMNAETAAWGRAIVALGLTANRKLASRQEVRARVEEQAAEQQARVSIEKTLDPPEKPAEAPSGPSQTRADRGTLTAIRGLYKRSGWPEAELRVALVAIGAQSEGPIADVMNSLTVEQAESIREQLQVDVLKVELDAKEES